MKKIDRIVFTTLNYDEVDHMYYILCDGNFRDKFYANSDDEAKEIFRKKSHARRREFEINNNGLLIVEERRWGVKTHIIDKDTKKEWDSFWVHELTNAEIEQLNNDYKEKIPEKEDYGYIRYKDVDEPFWYGDTCGLLNWHDYKYR